MLLWQSALSAFVLALARAGKSSPAKMAMMATTTSNSINVNAGRTIRGDNTDLAILITMPGTLWATTPFTLSPRKGKCVFCRTPSAPSAAGRVQVACTWSHLGIGAAEATCRFMESRHSLSRMHWDHEPVCGTTLVWCPAFRRSGPAEAGTPNGRFIERIHLAHSSLSLQRNTRDSSSG